MLKTVNLHPLAAVLILSFQLMDPTRRDAVFNQNLDVVLTISGLPTVPMLRVVAVKLLSMAAARMERLSNEEGTLRGVAVLSLNLVVAR